MMTKRLLLGIFSCLFFLSPAFAQQSDSLKTGQKETVENWEAYPSYAEYIAMMQGFATDYPHLCQLDTIGYSVQDRLLLAVRITAKEGDLVEPAVFFSSTMHGDETPPYMLMLRLIDYLLSNYGQDEQVDSLLNSMAIWINPLANPDGVYINSEDTIVNPRRQNANFIDLNRNFPDPEGDPHPEGYRNEPETKAMMDFMTEHLFALSANFHTGTEVINYPWDTWLVSSHRHPDEDWFLLAAHQYADTVFCYAPSTYMTSISSDGVTNGADWYQVDGSRQDYCTYYCQSREITFELYDVKNASGTILTNLWNWNYRSMLNYLELARFGLSGYITDSQDNRPIEANITVLDHDADGSSITSTAQTGYYHRLLAQGLYDIKVSAQGYFPKSIYAVSIENFQNKQLNVMLEKDPLQQSRTVEEDFDLRVIPHPIKETSTVVLSLAESESITAELYNLTGSQLWNMPQQYYMPGIHSLPLDLNLISPGYYIIKVSTGKRHIALPIMKP